MGASICSYPVPPPAALASPDPDTIHHAAREGTFATQERVWSMNAGIQIFNQYSLSTAIYSGELNKMLIRLSFENEKM